MVRQNGRKITLQFPKYWSKNNSKHDRKVLKFMEEKTPPKLEMQHLVASDLTAKGKEKLGANYKCLKSNGASERQICNP